MNRTEFEALRNLPDKVIRGDVCFNERRSIKPLLVAEDIRIENSHDVDARITVVFNPEVGSTSINVHLLGLGPICRLDVGGSPHGPAGRTHKHALQTERCPDRNLPDKVEDRPELSGRPIKELFETFCQMANIRHEGTFYPPQEVQGGGS